MDQQAKPSVIFANIANLLRVALFQGQHSQFVADAIKFLDECVANEPVVGAEPSAVTEAKSND